MHIIYLFVLITGVESKDACVMAGVANERRYQVCDCRSKQQERSIAVSHLHEDGALGLGGGWWGSRADGRVEDAEVDEPGTWVTLV